MKEFRARIISGKLKMPPETRKACDRWAAGQRDNDYIIRIIRITGKHSDSQRGIYWLRNQVLSEYIGCTKESVHETIMKRLNLGIFISKGNLSEFFRDSSRELSIDEYSPLIHDQDEICKLLNEGLEQDSLLFLPGEI